MLAVLEGKGYLEECQVTPDADPYECFITWDPIFIQEVCSQMIDQTQTRHQAHEDSCILKIFQACFNKRQKVILIILGEVPHTQL